MTKKQKEIPGQLLVMPETDLREIKVQGLLKDYPVPTDAVMAQQFLSTLEKHKDVAYFIRTTITWRTDYDSILVVLKSTDVDENEIHWEKKAKLNKLSKAEYERQLVDVAQDAHRMWLWYEEQKQ